MILAFWVKPGKDLELYFSHYNFLLRTESHSKAIALFFLDFCPNRMGQYVNQNSNARTSDEVLLLSLVLSSYKVPVPFRYIDL